MQRAMLLLPPRVSQQSALRSRLSTATSTATTASSASALLLDTTSVSATSSRAERIAALVSTPTALRTAALATSPSVGVVGVGVGESRDAFQAHLSNDLLVHWGWLGAAHTLNSHFVGKLNQTGLVEAELSEETGPSKETNEG